MLHRIRAIRKSEGGFTLTELLITIVILGVLAGVVVFAVTGFANDGKNVACETEKKNVQIASEAYYAKEGGYPAGQVDSPGRLLLLKNQGYLKDVPSVGNGYTITLGDGDGVVGPALCPFA